jgi:hypothetical protein
VHIFAGVVTNMDLDQSKLDKLTIDVDPDNEFVWNDPSLQKVSLSAGAPREGLSDLCQTSLMAAGDWFPQDAAPRGD